MSPPSKSKFTAAPRDRNWELSFISGIEDHKALVLQLENEYYLKPRERTACLQIAAFCTKILDNLVKNRNRSPIILLRSIYKKTDVILSRLCLERDIKTCFIYQQDKLAKFISEIRTKKKKS